MFAYFYKNNSDNREYPKDLTLLTFDGVAHLDIIFKANTDKAAATIELSYNDTLFEDANYCYIPELGYYYYMSEPVMSQQRLIFTLSEDLIQTYLEDVLELGCIISRQEKQFNAYLNDSRLPVLNKQEVTTQLFPYGFSDTHQEIIMAVNGGGGI